MWKMKEGEEEKDPGLTAKSAFENTSQCALLIHGLNNLIYSK